MNSDGKRKRMTSFLVFLFLSSNYEITVIKCQRKRTIRHCIIRSLALRGHLHSAVSEQIKQLPFGDGDGDAQSLLLHVERALALRQSRNE